MEDTYDALVDREDLLDVAKHVLASMVGSPAIWDRTSKEYAAAAVDYAQALIQEVNNASG